jgi:hypothetical protein
MNAFCRVAPSVRFSVLAILAASVFFRASVFNVRTSSFVQARRFDTFLAIKQLPILWKDELFVAGSRRKEKSCSVKLLVRTTKEG